MEYEEFEEKALAALAERSAWFSAEHAKRDGISVRWDTGGTSGGSCWGGESTPYPGEPEPEFEDLDAVLEAVCPGLSFLAYKGVLRDVVTRDSGSSTDYYNNRSDWAEKRFTLQGLHAHLEKRDLLSPT